MQYNERRGFLSAAIGSAVVSAIAAVIAHRMGLGQAARWASFVAGAFSVASIGLALERAVRRRQRLEVIADLLPRYRPRLDEDESLFEDPELDVGYAERFASSRADMRAATRALLVSLEDELQVETQPTRKAGHPACRRTRLRAAGRAERRRRRVVMRFAATPS